MKVLIYGFGWSGKATLELCESMGCDCYVIDDSLDISNFNDTRFITYEMLENRVLKGDIFDLYWIAVSGKSEIVLKIQNKLLSCGGGGKISSLQSYFQGYFIPLNNTSYNPARFHTSCLQNTQNTQKHGITNTFKSKDSTTKPIFKPVCVKVA